MFRMNYSTFKEVLMYIEHEITPNEVMGGHRVISSGKRLTSTLKKFLPREEQSFFSVINFEYPKQVGLAAQLAAQSEMLDPTCRSRLL